MRQLDKLGTRRAAVADVACRRIEAVKSTRFGFASSKCDPFCLALRKSLRERAAICTVPNKFASGRERVL